MVSVDYFDMRIAARCGGDFNGTVCIFSVGGVGDEWIFGGLGIVRRCLLVY